MQDDHTPPYGWLENESEKYREARRKLHQAELELRDQRERLAALRRELPLDTPVKDYLFREGPLDLQEDGPIREVRLSEMVQPGRPAVLYQFMYGRAQTNPCPMCSMWIDGLNGVVHHLQQIMTFAVVATAPIEQLRAWGAKRGWRGLPLLSCAETSFKPIFDSLRGIRAGFWRKPRVLRGCGRAGARFVVPQWFGETALS